MTRMTGKHFAILPLTLICLVAIGCGPDAKDLKIEDLTAENDQLKAELADRDAQLNDTIVRENEARATIDELNRELARHRATAHSQPMQVQPQPIQSVQSSPREVEGGWISTDGFDMISVSGSVLFPSGKATLTSQGRRALARIADDIRSRYSDRDIFVFGHTDNEPIRKSKWKDNWALGSERSLTVVRAMRNFGIPNGSLIQASCGQYRPKASNSSKRGRSQNRRVEFYAVKRNFGSSMARGYDGD